MTPRRAVSLIFAATAIIYFVLGTLSDQLADRVGPRGVIVAGGFLLCVGMLPASFTRHL